MARPFVWVAIRLSREGGSTPEVSIRFHNTRQVAIETTLSIMCRNIQTLHNFDPPATDEEIRAAALQYVRKISGFSKPSHANEAAFQRAVEQVAIASRELLAELVTSAPPKRREVEAARRSARARKRFAQDMA